MFDGDAGGKAHPAVGVAHERPGFLERRRGRSDIAQGLEFTTEFLFRGGVEPCHGRGGFLAFVADAIERSLSATTADGHIHMAILRADDGIGHGEGLAGGEDFLASLPSAALWYEVNGVERGVSPIAGEERMLIGGGEFSACAHRATRRAAWADVDQRRLHIEFGDRVIAGARAPAELASRRAEVDAGRAIPRRPHVPFHIRVVRENIAVWGDCAVIRIAETGRHANPVFPVFIHAGNPASDGLDANGVAIGVLEFLQQIVFVVMFGGGSDNFVVGKFRVVTAEDQDGAVAVENELVRAVFTCALEGAKHRLLGVRTVTLGIADAPDVAFTFFAGAAVKRAMGEEQAVTADKFRVDFGDDGLGRILQ